MTSTLVAPSDTPAWIVPAAPETEYTAVGINKDGELYVYGDTAANPGPPVPAVLGTALDLRISQHGSNSRYGPRDYIELTMAGPVPGTGFVLRLPCKGNPDTPWSVRSLLGALLALDTVSTPVKLQPKRGTDATFIQVYPHDAGGHQLPVLRAPSIGGARDDLELAVDQLRSRLGLPPQFSQPIPIETIDDDT